MGTLSALYVCLPLLSGGSWSAHTAELAGQVMAESKVATPALPATVRLITDDGQCLAEATTDVVGHYRLTAPPGPYFLAVESAGLEASGERIRLDPGSWHHTVVLPNLAPNAPPALASTVERETEAGPSVRPVEEGRSVRASQELEPKR